MVCTYCGSITRVVNSRHQVKSNQIWRRRQCRACHATFTSEEVVQYALAWRVRRGSYLQPFARDKLFLSLHKCCEHRQNALSDAQGLTDTVMGKLSGCLIKGSLTVQDITRTAQVALNRFDKAASTHYQAFHSS